MVSHGFDWTPICVISTYGMGFFSGILKCDSNSWAPHWTRSTTRCPFPKFGTNNNYYDNKELKQSNVSIHVPSS